MITVDRESQESLPEQVCDALLRLISSKWQDRDQLPSVRQLAASSGVSAWTINEAYRRLVARGVVTSRPGAGYFVARSSVRKATATPSSAARAVVQPVNAVSFVRNAVDPASHVVPAGTGFFPRSWIEDAIPVSVVSKVLRDPVMSTPAPAHGLLDFRHQIAAKLSLAGIGASIDQVVSTFGVTHAIQLICQHMLKPGDRVVIEDPSYMVQQAQLQAMGVELLAVQRRADGPDLNQLEDIARQHKPRLVFTQSTLHNPMGCTSSPANCYSLLTLAEKYEFHIVEDDTFGDLAPASTLRLASLDGFRRVFYVGSFTKVLSPAVRIGFVASPLADVESLLEKKVLGVLTGSALQEAIVSQMLKSGAYSAHVSSLRRRLTKAHLASRKALATSWRHASTLLLHPSSDPPCSVLRGGGGDPLSHPCAQRGCARVGHDLGQGRPHHRLWPADPRRPVHVDPAPLDGGAGRLVPRCRGRDRPEPDGLWPAGRLA